MLVYWCTSMSFPFLRFSSLAFLNLQATLMLQYEDIKVTKSFVYTRVCSQDKILWWLFQGTARLQYWPYWEIKLCLRLVKLVACTLVCDFTCRATFNPLFLVNRLRQGRKFCSCCVDLQLSSLALYKSLFLSAFKMLS